MNRAASKHSILNSSINIVARHTLFFFSSHATRSHNRGVKWSKKQNSSLSEKTSGAAREPGAHLTACQVEQWQAPILTSCTAYLLLIHCARPNDASWIVSTGKEKLSRPLHLQIVFLGNETHDWTHSLKHVMGDVTNVQQAPSNTSDRKHSTVLTQGSVKDHKNRWLRCLGVSMNSC